MWIMDRNNKANIVSFRGPRKKTKKWPLDMKFSEFEQAVNQIIYVSATPADYELEKTKGVYVEQIIRPTGLVDPELEVRPVKGQVDDLLAEIR